MHHEDFSFLGYYYSNFAMNAPNFKKQITYNCDHFNIIIILTDMELNVK